MGCLLRNEAGNRAQARARVRPLAPATTDTNWSLEEEVGCLWLYANSYGGLAIHGSTTDEVEEGLRRWPIILGETETAEGERDDEEGVIMEELSSSDREEDDLAVVVVAMDMAGGATWAAESVNLGRRPLVLEEGEADALTFVGATAGRTMPMWDGFTGGRCCCCFGLSSSSAPPQTPCAHSAMDASFLACEGSSNSSRAPSCCCCSSSSEEWEDDEGSL